MKKEIIESILHSIGLETLNMPEIKINKNKNKRGVKMPGKPKHKESVTAAQNTELIQIPLTKREF